MPCRAHHNLESMLYSAPLLFRSINGLNPARKRLDYQMLTDILYKWTGSALATEAAQHRTDASL